MPLVDQVVRSRHSALHSRRTGLMAPSHRGPTTQPSVVQGGVGMSWREVDQLGAAAGWPPEVPPWQPTPEPWPFARPPRTLPPVEPSRPALPEWWEPPAPAADLEAQLLDRRIVLLSGYLDSAAAN